MMPVKRLLSDEEARQINQRDLDKRIRAVKVSFRGRNAGLDENAGAPTSREDGVAERKVASARRRFRPSPNSQRAPIRPQASKGSPK